MSTLTRCRATYYEYTTTRALDVLDRHFEIDARLPAAGQLKIFAHYGWLDGPPSPLYVQRRMVQLARERYERALASAKRLHATPRQDRDLPDDLRRVREGAQLGGGRRLLLHRAAERREGDGGNRTILCSTRTWTRLTSSNTKRALRRAYAADPASWLRAAASSVSKLCLSVCLVRAVVCLPKPPDQSSARPHVICLHVI